MISSANDLQAIAKMKPRNHSFPGRNEKITRNIRERNGEENHQKHLGLCKKEIFWRPEEH